MVNRIETIIAKAMSASKAWPAVFEAGSAAELARAVLADLDMAGFAVVPKEPTEEMLDDAIDEAGWQVAPYIDDAEEINALGKYAMASTYRTMLAARPK